MRHLILFLVMCLSVTIDSYSQNTVGTLTYDEEKVYDGFNLIYPHNQSQVFLFNNCGDIINTWTDDADFRPGNSAYLLENGNLVKTKRYNVSINDPIWAGGGGGIVDIKDWDNNLLQSFELNNENARLHHDIAATENGTILMIAWEVKTKEEAISAGRDTGLLPNNMLWPDYILEWDPEIDEIIWEWHVWDHLIQDYDTSRSNFGIVSDHPELIDINYDEHDGHQDWLHSNSIDYNPVLDHILLSVPYFNEVWIIDHSTTTQEASSHSGGESGRGGDLLFRWGNPQTYRAGTIADKKFFFQHDLKWVSPNADHSTENFGKISLYNNRVNQRYSSLNVLNTEFDVDNNKYQFGDDVFLPLDFSIDVVHPDTLISAASNGLSSAQILPNNNILGFAGRWGYAYELTSDNEIVWEYKVPLRGGSPVEQGAELTISNNITFRMDRYSTDFAGFEGRDLSRGPRIELEPNDLFCEVISATKEENIKEQNISLIQNPVYNTIFINSASKNSIQITDMRGWVYGYYDLRKGKNEVDVSSLNSGIYFIGTSRGEVLKFVKTSAY